MDDVSDCFVEELMNWCPIDGRLQKLADYFVEIYISKDFFYISKLPRLTNACKSFHEN